MIQWLQDNAWWLAVASVAMMLCGMGIVIAIAILMPADHFLRPRRPSGTRRHVVLRLLVRAIKNVLGVLLLVAGLIMAVPMVPGPGLLLVVLGISLLDIPGKQAMERYIVSRPLVLRPLNALRARFHRPPLQLPEETPAKHS